MQMNFTHTHTLSRLLDVFVYVVCLVDLMPLTRCTRHADSHYCSNNVRRTRENINSIIACVQRKWAG